MPDFTPQTVLSDAEQQRNARISSFGHLLNVSPIQLIGGTHEGASLDTSFWDTAESANGGTVVSSASTAHAELKTNTTANGSSVLRSKIPARFLAGYPNNFLAGVRLGDTGAANNKRRWGAFDSQNGCFFELDGTTLYVVTRKGASDTRTDVTGGHSSGTTIPTIDTAYHVYEISYSSGNVSFFQDRKCIANVSSTTDGFSNTPHLKLGFENTNSGGSTSNVSLYIRGASISRLGPTAEAPRYFNSASVAETRVLKTLPGRLHRIVINKKGGASDTATVYDNAAGSGTKIATIDLGNANVAGVLEYNTNFHTGLTIVTNGTTADFTVIYD